LHAKIGCFVCVCFSWFFLIILQEENVKHFDISLQDFNLKLDDLLRRQGLWITNSKILSITRGNHPKLQLKNVNIFIEFIFFTGL